MSELRIYKYPIPIEDGIPLALPTGATLLTVQVQHGVLCVWALVDPDAPPVRRLLRILGTGHPFPEATDPHRYLGTVQLAGGGLVFHVFEMLEQTP